MSESVGLSRVRAFARVLGSLDAAGTTDQERIDLIRALEELKGAAAAAQARVTVAFDDSQGSARSETPSWWPGHGGSVTASTRTP